MALIPKFLVCTALQEIDSDASEPIKEGNLVTLTSAGIKRVIVGLTNRVYGLAADTFSTTASSMPGIYDGWQNRVSDGYDETKASGKITVYHSGGEFASDQFTNTGTALDSTKVGQVLIANSDGVLAFGGTDVITVIAASAQPVAMLTRAAGAYPSGVPGTDTGLNGDMALKGDNSNTYIEFKLLV